MVAARITLTSTGVGHHFPTYVTPRVVVRAALVDSDGREAPASAEERVIGRELSLDLSRELFDTRVPAGGRFAFDYRRRVERTGLSLRVRVTVHPDHFYTRFFESLLASGAGGGTAEIQMALEATRCGEKPVRGQVGQSVRRQEPLRRPEPVRREESRCRHESVRDGQPVRG